MKFEILKNDIIKKYGFEDIHTIIFFGLCDRYEEGDCPESSIWETYADYVDEYYDPDEYYFSGDGE